MATAATTETPSKSDLSAVRTPEHLMRMRVGRTIGRGVWLASHKAEFPDATKEERKAAWEAARKDFTKIGLKAMRTLEKSGFKVVEADAV